MADAIFIQILKHLDERNAINEYQIDITDFLKAIWNKSDTSEESNNLNRINKALISLRGLGFADYDFLPAWSLLNENKVDPFTNELRRCTLDNTKVQARLTNEGFKYIREEIRKESQDKLANATGRNIVIARRLTIATGILSLIALILNFVGVDISTKALNQNRKQFAIETTPFIQIKDIKLSRDTLSRKINIEYQLVNYGRDQAKILSGSLGSISGYRGTWQRIEAWPTEFDKLRNIVPDSFLINAYVIKENPINGKWSFPDSIKIMEMDAKNKDYGKTYLPYFIGMIRYTYSGIESNFRRYYFIIQLDESFGSDYHYIYNENLNE